MEECICQVLEEITAEVPAADAAPVVPEVDAVREVPADSEAATWVIPAVEPDPRWAAAGTGPAERDGNTDPRPAEAAVAALCRWSLPWRR